MIYEIEEENDDKDEMMRNASVNHVFTSKFMLNFAQNLEQLIRTDLKEENGKSDIVLRTLSRAGSQNFLPEDYKNSSPKSSSRSVSHNGVIVPLLNNTEVGVAMEVTEH
jgi:hypothetical protein